MLAELLAAFPDALTEVSVNAIRHIELFVFRPAVVAFGEADFLFTQRFSMSRAGVLLVGRAISNVAVDND